MEATSIKPITRRSVLQLSLAGAIAAMLSLPKPATAANTEKTITVWKTPTCGCCKAWVVHLKKNGFDVVINDVDDTGPIRKKFDFPDKYGACHTAKLGNYVLEGHVPAEEIRKLLKDKPQARGLSVPGMPLGSPGMEGTGRLAGLRDAFDVLLVLNDGNASVFKSYTAITSRPS